jgi:hypothetical protein
MPDQQQREYISANALLIRQPGEFESSSTDGNGLVKNTDRGSQKSPVSQPRGMLRLYEANIKFHCKLHTI